MDAARKAKLDAVERTNFNHLVLEAVWFGIAAVTIRQFLAIYAIRLGATPLELGWLEAFPALVLFGSTWLGNWWNMRSSDTVQAIFWPTLWRRMSFLLLALTPFVPPGWQMWWLIFSVALPAIPQSITAVINPVLWREAAGDHRLTNLLSRRSLATNIAIGTGGLAFGFWLERAPFPANYQVMFSAGFLIAMLSLWHIRQIKVVPANNSPGAQAVMSSLSLLAPWRSVGFRRVAFVALITYIAHYSMKPVIPLRLVSELGAGEGFMAVYGMVNLIAAVTIAMFTGRIVRHIGNRSMIALGMALLMLEALVLMLVPHLALSLPAAALSGAGWTMTGIGLFGFLAEHTPAKKHYTVAYQQTTYLAAFIGPMIGSSLANQGITLFTVLLLGAGIRLLAGVLTRY
jgi:predicted MFS family arabinose efflux permease